jgi:hypothetical protein
MCMGGLTHICSVLAASILLVVGCARVYVYLSVCVRDHSCWFRFFFYKKKTGFIHKGKKMILVFVREREKERERE